MGVMEAASLVAAQSNCVRRQVGAVIVGPDMKTVVSYGYNHVHGAVTCRDVCPRASRSYQEVPAFSDYRSGPGRCDAIHAEADALFKARGKDLTGCTMVLTCPPCPQCQRALDSTPLQVIYPEGSSG